jgi:hypothetical protein
MLKVDLVFDERFHSTDEEATTYVDRELKSISTKNVQPVVWTGVQVFEGS